MSTLCATLRIVLCLALCRPMPRVMPSLKYFRITFFSELFQQNMLRLFVIWHHQILRWKVFANLLLIQIQFVSIFSIVFWKKTKRPQWRNQKQVHFLIHDKIYTQHNNLCLDFFINGYTFSDKITIWDILDGFLKFFKKCFL